VGFLSELVGDFFGGGERGRVKLAAEERRQSDDVEIAAAEAARLPFRPPRTDGLYVGPLHPKDLSRWWLWFSEDGGFASAVVEGDASVASVATWLHDRNHKIGKGSWKNHLGTLLANWTDVTGGVVIFSGPVGEDALFLTWEAILTGKKGKLKFEFEPID
jgi:hypothetical protein